MATTNFLAGKIVSLKDDGTVNAGGKVYFYTATGTFSVSVSSYSDVDLTTPNANPLVLDASGRGTGFISGNADVKITDSADVTIYTARDISPQAVTTVYSKALSFDLDSTYLDAIVETTAALTITLDPASSLGAGFSVTIVNTSAGTVVVARANAGDTINGVAANVNVSASSSATFTVNAGVTGFITNTIGFPITIAQGGTGQTSAATARTALAVGGLADTNVWTAPNTFQDHFEISNTALKLWLNESGAAADNGRWRFLADAEGLKLQTSDDASTGFADILSVERTGTVVDIVTIGGANVVLTGGQLKFPATDVPSSDVNTLDDYEEGTWTPSIGGTATYGGGGQLGRYIKIGKMVYVDLYLFISAIGTGSTTVISGLPFTASATYFATAQCGLWSSAATSCVGINAYISPGTTIITVGALAAASAASGTAAVFTTGTNLRLSMTYLV